MASCIRVSAQVLQLLLAAGLLRFAHGSVSPRDQEVSFPRVAAALDGQVGQIHAQVLKTKDSPSATAHSPAATTVLAVDGGRTLLDVLVGDRPMFLPESSPVSATNRHRKLQDSQTSTCVSSISVKSSVFPFLEGCLERTAIDPSIGFDTAYVSDTAAVGYGELTTITFEDSDLEMVVWAAYFLENPWDDYETACISLESAEDVDVSEATWLCDTDRDGFPELYVVEAEVLSVSCDCSSSTSSPSDPSYSLSTGTPSPTPPTTPTPIAPPTTRATTPEPASTPTPSPDADDDSLSSTNTCTGDGSFTISASAASALDGCFGEVGSSGTDETVVYTVSGTSDTAEFVVTSVESKTGDFNWHIVFMPSGADGSGNSQTYCISEEPSSEVNPASASWSCDFTGDGENFSTATEDDISIVCGSCTTAVVPEGDASSASKLIVGIITAAGAGIVAVGASLCAL